MDRSATWSDGSPPRIRCCEAGNVEADRMTIQQRGDVRFLPWTGAAILLGFIVGIPGTAESRAYKPTGPPYTEGDPTADDQPSPTPKPARTNPAVHQRFELETTGPAAARNARLIWLSTVRVWIQIALR